MGDKPTYEELEKRVRELEREKAHRELNFTVLNNSSPMFEEKKVRESNSSKPNLDAVIDRDEIQSIMDEFYFLTGKVTAILDLEGNVL